MVLLSLATPYQARPTGFPGEVVAPPSPPALEEAVRSAAVVIRTNSATSLGESISIAEPNLICTECNCTFSYTAGMTLGDVQYSVNFLLSFVQSVMAAGTIVEIRSSNNSIVVTTNRKLEAMPVQDVRSYDSFQMYLEDREAAEKLARHLTTARDLCTK
jgi:hypothetical protein